MPAAPEGALVLLQKLNVWRRLISELIKAIYTIQSGLFSSLGILKLLTSLTIDI